jgi:NTE family protein
MGATIEFAAGAVKGRLCSIPLFGALDEIARAALETELEWLSLPGGQTLFREDEPGDALYVVLTGRLGVMVRGNDGRDILVAHVAAGETVGEMALLDGGSRSATVIALRDSELLRLGKRSYERLVERHPRSMLSLILPLVRRLRHTTHRCGSDAPIRTLAVSPLDLTADSQRIARDLAAALAIDGRRIHLLDCRSAGHPPQWFSAVETASDLVIYCTDGSDTPWTKLCLRQADRVLLIASSNSSFIAPKWLTDHAQVRHQLLDLVLLHDGSRSADQSAEDWRKRLPVNLVCHVRLGNADDLARIARLLRGKAIGLVLSAGGARGFAHLGVVRALRQAQIPIDVVGGCSMGAIVGAGVALEWNDAEIRERLHRAFVRSNPINDYTLPFLSLAKGQKVARLLEQNFGNIRIGDLWRPFFCVSANLTVGLLAVHRDGPLVPALRASIAIPGLLPPVAMAEEAHVDGGMMNYLPVDVMSSMCGATIAVDVASDPAFMPIGDASGLSSVWQFLRHGRMIPPIVDLLFRAATVSSEVVARAARRQAGILFKPPLETINLLDWAACDAAIEAGYRHAIEKLEHLDKAALGGPW